MKKPIYLAASLAASSIGLAGVPPSQADPMFQVTAGSPGALTFSGTGTAQFNNSIGTNNSFQVGSSTNLGVNASTSATPEYNVTSTAKLDLAGTSTLQQVIGTSGTFKESTAAAQAAYSVATEATSTHLVQAGWGASYDATNVNAAGNKGYTTEASWKAAYAAAYQSQYEQSYDAAYSTMSQNRQAQGTDGVISGSFRTVESGSARASGSAADWSSSSTTKANAAVGSTWGGVSSAYSTKADWQAAWDSSYNTAYAQASASSNRFSDSAVTVRGIGSDARVQAASSSTFNVGITGDTGFSGSTTTATANGSAGANLATSSFANQSQASTASAFMQAFGGSGT